MRKLYISSSYLGATLFKHEGIEREIGEKNRERNTDHRDNEEGYEWEECMYGS